MKFISHFTFRFFATLVLTFLVHFSNAQIKLNGTYVATKITYLNDNELPDADITKYTYLKYAFNNQHEISISNVYDENGPSYFYTITGNSLIIRNNAGMELNRLKILKGTDEILVLVSSAANNSLEDPWAIKYTLQKEELVQQKIALSPKYIHSVNKKDTIFKAGEKIYAKFKKPSFEGYINEIVSEKKYGVNGGKLLSTFIVDENGQADSLKIIQGINAKYDAAYIKAFNSAKRMWQPAQYNGKNVKVLMSQSIKYLGSDTMVPSYFSSQKANVAYKNQEYKLALLHYDEALASRDDEVIDLYRRGICKKMLGNLKGACEDWKKIQLLGNKTADELLNKFCK